MFPLVLGHMRFEDIPHNVPELVVVVLQQHHEPSGLRVEGRGNLFERRTDNLFDLRVGDRTLFVEGVDASSEVDSVLEGHGLGGGGRHGGREGTGGGGGGCRVERVL